MLWPMIDEQHLGYFANFLCILVISLAIDQHYIVADLSMKGLKCLWKDFNIYHDPTQRLASVIGQWVQFTFCLF